MQRRFWDFLAPLSNADLMGAFAQVIPYGIYSGGELRHDTGFSFVLDPAKYVMPHGLIVIEDDPVQLNISALVTQGISSTYTVVATNENIGSIQTNAVNYEFLTGKLLSEGLDQFSTIPKQFLILGWLHYIVEDGEERFVAESITHVQDQREIIEEQQETPIHIIAANQSIDIPFNPVYDPAVPATPLTQTWELVEGEPSLVLEGSPIDYRFNWYIQNDFKLIREIGIEATIPHNTKIIIEPVLPENPLIDPDTFTLTFSQLGGFTERVHAKIAIPEAAEINRAFVRFYIQGSGYVDNSHSEPIDKRIKLHRLVVSYRRKT